MATTFVQVMGWIWVLTVLFILFMFVVPRTDLTVKFPSLVQFVGAAKQVGKNIEPLILWGFIAFTIMYGILLILRAITCTKPGGGTNKHFFESFAEMPNTTEELTQRVIAATDRVTQNLEDLVSLGDPTCSIVRNVEDAYINDQAALSEAELQTSPADQSRLRTERQTRARTQFLKRRKLCAGLNSTAPILECFVGTSSEDSLQNAVNQLQQVLDNTESQAAIQSAEQMRVALLFAQRMMSKAMEGFVDLAPTAVAASDAMLPVRPTSPTVALTGNALKQYAYGLLKREDELNITVAGLKQDISNIQASLNGAQNTAARALSGKPTAADIAGGINVLRKSG